MRAGPAGGVSRDEFCRAAAHVAARSAPPPPLVLSGHAASLTPY